ncbi:PH domain-containing protein [Candidatus Micrarchaeota archaeon]|nr:PH domain-containing protein [Candidatus Micrarchaeota archaeon]
MVYSFHPFPIVSSLKTFIICFTLVIVIFVIRDYLGSMFLPLVGLIALIGILRITAFFAVARSYTVSLDENSIIYTSGIISRREFILPCSKVTESGFSQGIIQRMFGVGNLNIDTPGGSDMVIRLKDVHFKDIQKTLDLIKNLK